MIPRKWMRALDTADRGEHAARYISNANPMWNAMLRDTVAPTMLQAGIRANVIPSEARGVMNIRLLPGNQLEPLLAKLQQLVNDPADPALRSSLAPSETAPSSSLNSDLYASIVARHRRRISRRATSFPMMSTGATDSTPLRLRSVQAYGVLPFPLERRRSFAGCTATTNASHRLRSRKASIFSTLS